LCTSGGLFGGLVLQRLLASPQLVVVGIIKSTRVLHPEQGWFRGVFDLLHRCGARYTLYLGCATGLVDSLGRWAGLPPVERAARLRDLPVLATPDLNRAAGLDFVDRQRPDLLVSAFFNQRIGEQLCAVPPGGAVNIHPSLLPDFKGVDPLFHARLSGAERLGVSVHRVTPELDAGGLLAQIEVPLDSAASLLAGTALLFDNGARLLLDCLPEILQGAAGQPQPPGGSYDSWPTPAKVRQFRRDGNRLMRLDDLRLLRPGGLRESV
jgi:hypothetical protein